VAVISGYMTIDAAVASSRFGADAVLSKPVRPSEIIRQLMEGPPEPNLEETISLARVEYEHIARVLADCNGNISEAARRLGIHRHSLQRKLKKPAPKE
jgi:two-component system response regulator RegA